MTKATRRRKGEGSLSTSKDKRTIEAKITLPSGKRRKRTVRRLNGETTKEHRRRASAVLTEMHAELEAGRTESTSHTVATYAAVWNEALRDRVAKSTRAGYARIIQHYVLPYLGDRPLASLTVEDVEQLDAILHGKGLSHTTRRHARHRLAALLRHARRHGHVGGVVTDNADPVKRGSSDTPTAASRKRAEMALPPDQLGRLLHAAKEERLQALVVFILYTGVRRGEALALGWDAVDLDNEMIEIRRAMATIDPPDARAYYELTTPKTAGSWRTTHVPAEVVSALKTWRSRQARERLAAGGDYLGTMLDFDDIEVPLVFTDEIGRALEPDDIRRLFDRVGARAGVGHVHPHQLRHSVTSVRIDAGEDHTIISNQLGHANPAITLSVYAHSFAASRRRAASTMSDAIAAAAEGTQ